MQYGTDLFTNSLKGPDIAQPPMVGDSGPVDQLVVASSSLFNLLVRFLTRSSREENSDSAVKTSNASSSSSSAEEKESLRSKGTPLPRFILQHANKVHGVPVCTVRMYTVRRYSYFNGISGTKFLEYHAGFSIGSISRISDILLFCFKIVRQVLP